MKDKTKKTLKTAFGSLIMNDYAIEGAKTGPLWLAIVFFVIGTFLPIVPIMVNASKTYGASFLSNNIYSYETNLASCAIQLKDVEHYAFNVENNTLVARKDGAVQEQTWTEVDAVSKDETPIAYYEATRDGITQREFEIYYSDRPYNKTTKSITALKKTIENRIYVQGGTELYNQDVHGKNASTYKVSYLLLYKDGMFSRIYAHNNTTTTSSTYTNMDWKNAKFDELLTNILTVNGVEQNVYNDIYLNGVLDNFKAICNDAYKNQKTYTFWFNSGLYYGIYLALGFFMGFMIWILTRGKNNPNRGLNILTAFKISWWIDFTPGLLALAVGFMWNQAAGLAYIVLMGIRTMWLSMRSLNPAPVQQ